MWKKNAAGVIVPIYGVSGVPADDDVAIATAGSLAFGPQTGGAGGGGGGAISYLAGASVVNAAALSLAAGFSDAYDRYIAEIRAIPLLDNQDLKIRVTQDAGATWDSGASDYGYTWVRGRAGYTAADHDSWWGDNAEAWAHLASNVGNASGEGATGRIYLENFRDASMFKLWTAQIANISDVGEVARQEASGVRFTLSKLNGIQLYYLGANITGSIRLFGVSAVPGGTTVLYDSGVLAAPAATIDTGATIPGTFSSLDVELVSMRTTEAVLESSFRMRFNNDSGSNYVRQYVRGRDTATSAPAAPILETGFALICPGASAGASVFSNVIMRIPGYAAGSHNKMATWTDSHVGDAGAQRVTNTQGGRFFSNAAITRISLHPNAGNFPAGCRMIVRGLP